MSLELLKPTIEMKREFYDFIDEWEKSGEEITPASVNLEGRDYKSWLEHKQRMENKETCPPDRVPAYTYVLVNESMRILGAVNIRHYLNEYLLNYGGHIGYGVRPTERRKGHASIMLSLALPIANEVGITRVLVTCDKKNIGSARTIIKNGGVLENEVWKDDKLMQRYWIENK